MSRNRQCSNEELLLYNNSFRIRIRWPRFPGTAFFFCFLSLSSGSGSGLGRVRVRVEVRVWVRVRVRVGVRVGGQVAPESVSKKFKEYSSRKDTTQELLL